MFDDSFEYAAEKEYTDIISKLSTKQTIKFTKKYKTKVTWLSEKPLPK